MKLGAVMGLANWVRTARVKGGFTQDRLGELLGVTKANISAWENGRHDPSVEQMEKISELTGEPLPFNRGNVSPAGIGSRQIPVLDRLQAGEWKSVRERGTDAEPSEFILTDLALGPDAFAMRIQGQSMLPAFEENDIVVLDPAVAPRPGDFVCASNGSGEALFKKYRVRGIDEGGKEVFELVPLNADYPTLRSDTTELAVVATMMEHRKYRRK